MDKKKDLIANSIIKSIIFIAIFVSLVYIIQPLLNGVVIDVIVLEDKTKELVYSSINFNLLTTLTITSLGFIILLFLSNLIKNILATKNIDKNDMFSIKINKIYSIIEIIILPLILILNIYFVFKFPLSFDKYNSNAFSFNIASILMIIILLISNIYINYISSKKKESSTMDISIVAEASVLAALAVVLSLVSKMIPGLELPNGGSFSLSMLPLFIFALRRGVIPGLIIGAVYGMVNFITDGFILHWGSIFFDYLIPFSLLSGVAGIFKNKAEKGLVQYTVIAVLLGGFVRYVFHGLSGVIFFAQYAGETNAWFYSFILYNLPYMAVSTAGSAVMAVILQKRLITKESRIK